MNQIAVIETSEDIFYESKCMTCKNYGKPCMRPGVLDCSDYENKYIITDFDFYISHPF
jgi:hypothetical protein